MIALIFVLICAAIYGVFIVNRNNELLNPIVCFVYPIILQVSVYLIFYSKSYLISEKTMSIYTLGIVMYCLGYMISSIGNIRCYKKEIELEQINVPGKLEKIVKAIGYIAVFLSVIDIIKMMFSGPYGSNFVLNVRWVSLYGNYSRSGLAIYGLFIYSVLAKIWLYNSIVNNDKNIRFKPYLLYVLLSLFSSMSRTGLLEALLSLIYILALGVTKKRFILDKRKVSLVSLSFLFVLAFVGVTFGRGQSTNNLFSMDSVFYSYLVEPLIGFDEKIFQIASEGNGYYIMGALASVFAVLGIKFETIGAYINNYGGKVFTYIAGPYFDAGEIGVALTMLMNGIVLGYIYKKNIKNRGRWAILYTSCIYSMVIAFFDYQFFMMSQVYTILILLFTTVDFSEGKLRIKRFQFKKRV